MAGNNATNFSNPLTIPQGGTGAASFTAYSVLCGGTTSTNPFQNVSGVGTSGQILTSNGAGALPTWQSTGVQVLSQTTILTSAQIKALTSTPITVVTNAGTNTVVLVIGSICKMTYGGTNAFGSSGALQLKYTNASGPSITGSFGVTMTGTVNQYGWAGTFSNSGTSTTFSAQNVIFTNSGSVITGNAAGDNTLTVTVFYLIFPV